MVSGIDRIGALNKAFEFIYKSEITGVYCEFGVFQGVSLIRAIKANNAWKKKSKNENIIRFFGFDSFRGLPKITEPEKLKDYYVFNEGQFNDTSIQLVYDNLIKENISIENIDLIEGLYEDSLKDPVNLLKLSKYQIAIAHIDCDLYSSACQCLSFLTGRICDGAVVLFDDWFCFRGHPEYGVHKAFDEWCEKENYKVSEYFNYSWAGKAFIINEPVGG